MDRVGRRAFVQRLGIHAAMLPFLQNLASVTGAEPTRRKQRLVIVFSPNGIVPQTFWPDAEGEKFALKEALLPLAPFQNRSLILHGICDKIRGDGDQHMRGIGCLLTGIELFKGNVLGGCTEHPAGWAKGHSIDQEIKTFLQSKPETRTRFGSLEFGVMVADRADTWTRMVYEGPNKPVAPIGDPYQMFGKLYGRQRHQKSLASVLDGLQQDFKTVSAAVNVADRRLLEEHASMVRAMEKELRETRHDGASTPPVLEKGVKQQDADMPKLSKMQIELMVQGFVGDFNRVATLQYNYSTSDATMPWLKIEGRHHDMSHKPDTDLVAQRNLTRIDQWYCEQVAYLAKRLAETPEPGGTGSLLDNTTIVWTNELGKGNSHTHENIPFVLVGGGLNFKMGRSVKYPSLPHNRLLLSLAHGMGHRIGRFGNGNYCGDGVLPKLT